MININLKALIGKQNPLLKETLEAAAGLAMSRGHFNVEIEHWLLKILDKPDSELMDLVTKFDLDPGKLYGDLNRALDRIKNGNTRAPSLSPNIVELSKNTWMLASVEFGHPEMTSGHLLSALLLEDTTRRQAVESSSLFDKIAPESLKEVAKGVIGSTSETFSAAAYNKVQTTEGGQQMAKPSSHPSLDLYTENLTQKGRDGGIDAVLGRDDEIRQLIDILIRRRQNNPILTGEAGVGKTAVVEGFALRIAMNDVPDALKGVELRSLDLAALQAGASVKGEFENRLKSVIEEVKASPTPIIMFIDEAHTLIGAGGKEGQGDAANLLKPALARGELRTVAATTWSEYKKYFEKDPALTRRFQVVDVAEPSEAVAIDMMRGIAKALQNHHKVEISDEAIQASVKLSHRYIPARQLPDKSVSLLDTACARVSLGQSATPAIIENTRRRIEQCETNIERLEQENAYTGTFTQRIDDLKAEKAEREEKLEEQEAQWESEKSLIAEVKSIRKQLEEDYMNAKTDGAEVLSPEDNVSLKAQLATLMTELKTVQGDDPLMQPSVDEQAVAEVVANWTGIPVGKMVSDEIHAVLNLKNVMRERVIGQDHSMELIARTIQTSRAGLTDPRKPQGVFLLAGPSGTGKTETALTVADQLFGGEQNMTTINMSEFKEEHKISMLLGASAGYVGYGEGGVLTEAVRRKPYSVVLLDEMEKAHPGIQDIFYNLFDKGTIKDGEGRDIDFKNTVIIMTSNAASDAISQICMREGEPIPDPELLVDSVRPELLKAFRPAFLGRTQVIPYYPLTDDVLVKICDINMNRIRKRLKGNYDATFTYDEDVLIQIVARCQEVDTGARNIENIISKTLLPMLSTACLTHMADGHPINAVHIGIDEESEDIFTITINPA